MIGVESSPSPIEATNSNLRPNESRFLGGCRSCARLEAEILEADQKANSSETELAKMKAQVTQL